MVGRKEVISTLSDIQKHLEAQAKLQHGAGVELFQSWADTVLDTIALIKEQHERIEKLLINLNAVLEECKED